MSFIILSLLCVKLCRWCHVVAFKCTFRHGITRMDFWLNGRKKTINEILKQEFWEFSTVSWKTIAQLLVIRVSWECSASTNGTCQHAEWICRGLFGLGDSEHCTGFIQPIASTLQAFPAGCRAQAGFLLLVPTEVLLLLCWWWYSCLGSAQSCLHVPQGFLCSFWMKPGMVCKGCICSDFRLHESSHTVFNLSLPAVFVQHCSWSVPSVVGAACWAC